MATLHELVKQKVAELIAVAGPNARRKNTKTGQLLKRYGVTNSAELKRILQLPRRQWESDPELADVTRAMTEHLRLPGGEKPCHSECTCPRELWPHQAVTLLELVTYKGAFAPQGVGKGKALTSLLGPVVLDSQRPVLFVPAQLRDQTLRKVIPMTRRHWRLNPRLRVHGYSELSLAKNKRMLFDLRPDLIELDEAHSVKNPQSARAKRLKEYLAANPETVVLPLSGTMARRSMKDYWQLLRWGLKPDRCPLPGDWPELTDWSLAIDEGVPPHDRIAPGALMLLLYDDEEEEHVRIGFRRRLIETPGVVATSDTELGTSLSIREHKIAVPGRVLGLMANMRANWETPYGELLTEAVDLWRHMRELACGFFYRWDPPPPLDWIQARAEWHEYVREKLRHNRIGLDSPLVVANYLDGLMRDGREKVDPEGCERLEAWRAVKHTYEINTVAEWVDDFALNAAAEWIAASVDDEHPAGGIVWSEHVAFGERLAEVAGVPYFGAGMKASAEILDHEGPMVASISAHGEGKNLQRWSRMLLPAPPSSGKTWEQLLGRTHRQGQLADEVEVDVWQHAEELVASVRQAVADARYLEATLGSRQKLCYANLTLDLGGM